MTAPTLKDAVATYFAKEPKWMEAGGDPALLMRKVASDTGLTYDALRDGILDHCNTLGAG